jgi:hypothetical protein
MSQHGTTWEMRMRSPSSGGETLQCIWLQDGHCNLSRPRQHQCCPGHMSMGMSHLLAAMVRSLWGKQETALVRGYQSVSCVHHGPGLLTACLAVDRSTAQMNYTARPHGWEICTNPRAAAVKFAENKCVPVFVYHPACVPAGMLLQLIRKRWHMHQTTRSLCSELTSAGGVSTGWGCEATYTCCRARRLL